MGGDSPLLHLQPVSHPWLGNQIARPRRISLQLVPELSHRHPHVVTLILVPRPPDQFEKLPPGHHFARVLDQDREQFVLNGRQVNLVSLNKHLPAYQVYSKLAHFKLPIVRAYRQRMASATRIGPAVRRCQGLSEIIVGPASNARP